MWTDPLKPDCLGFDNKYGQSWLHSQYYSQLKTVECLYDMSLCLFKKIFIKIFIFSFIKLCRNEQIRRYRPWS